MKLTGIVYNVLNYTAYNFSLPSTLYLQLCKASQNSSRAAVLCIHIALV